jgi:hypothetical protein
MMRYEVVPARYWLNQRTQRTASCYGSHPGNGSDDADWQVVENGWTIRDNVAGTVGMSRQPFATEREAADFIASRPQIFRQREVA